MSSKPVYIASSDSAAITRSVEVLERGGVIIYPTDTVYGIGADATNPDAVQAVMRIKEREPFKPLVIIVDSMNTAQRYVHLDGLAQTLAERFWPGPLTMQLHKRDDTLIPPVGDAETVALRVPRNDFCLALTQALGGPLVSTSVNISGQPQAYALRDMLSSLGHNLETVDLVIDAGDLPHSQPSTIITIEDGAVRILREGAVSKATLAEFM